MKDGAINLTVSGGEAPYHYSWSNGDETEDISELAAGYYRVDVVDGIGRKASAQITLEQPLPMKLDVDVYEYANGYNISCYECNNGSVSVVVMGGAAPFTASWSDGPSGLVRYNLGPKDYKFTVADANGCGTASASVSLRGPERSDWSMSGNPNTTPGMQYIGTPDNKDVVFKSNGQERLRLKSNGEIRLWGADTIAGPLYRDYDGILKIGTGPVLGPNNPCYYLTSRPYWLTKGNNFSELCPMEPRPILGTLSNDHLPIYTYGVERIRVTANGKVGIGTTSPLSQLHVEGDLLVRGGTGGDIVTSFASVTGPVLWARNNQAAWGLSTSTDGKGHVLGNWTTPQPIMTFTGNRVGVVTTDPEATLHVDGDLLVRGAGWNGEMVTSSSASTGPIIWARNYQGAWGLSVDPDGKGHILDDWSNPHPLLTFTNGKVGVGENSPESALHVQGDLLVRGSPDGDIVTSSTSATGPVLWARNSQAAWGLSIDANGKGHILGDWNNPHPVMTFAYDKVGIGTDDMPGDDFSLFVRKGILTERVKVRLIDNWPDFVFYSDYELISLDTLDRYIKKHHHLPDLPSTEDIKRDGLDLGNSNALLARKIEELTLYTIYLNNELNKLKNHIQ